MAVICDEQSEFGLYDNSVDCIGHDTTQNIQALNVLCDIERNKKSGEEKRE
jgi:hypothetical protein